MPGNFYNVKDYGAAGDGIHIDSPAVNNAINAASEKGGGTVYFPAGTYYCYSIRLKSNIALYLDHGAVIKAAIPDEEHHYDIAEPNESCYQDFGHSHWHNSLIWGEDLHNVSVLGFGLIDGSKGLTRWEPNPDDYPSANKAIALKECRNVTIRDISLLQCGHFALLLTGVDNLTISNVKCDTNRDGFDIDCCANVRISDCTVNTCNDDAIVLKSSYALGYAKSTENVTITNCLVSGYDTGSLLDGTFTKTVVKAPDKDGPTGRIKFGTESNGGFRNITISNCIFDHCRGIALETVDGGVIEDINITNISMRDINNSPIYIRLGNRARGPENMPMSIIRRVKINDITVKDADCRYASIIFGLNGYPVEDITLSNIHIQYKGGYSMEDVANQRGSNKFFTRINSAAHGTPEHSGGNEEYVNKHPEDPYFVSDMDKGYPEPSAHGILPTYGLFIKNASNVTIENVVMETIYEDKRPAIVLTNIEGIMLSNIKVQESSEVPYIIVRNVKNLKISNFYGIKDKTMRIANKMKVCLFR